MKVMSRYFSQKAVLSAALLALPLLVLAVIAGGAAPAPKLVYMNFCFYLIAVLGLNAYSGNTGILSFGHVGFIALGAQISATLTMPPIVKASSLPLLPDFLQGAQLGLFAASSITLVCVALIAAVVAIPICRLSGASATIATLGFLIVVNSVIIGAQGVTRGSQAMFGIPPLVTVPIATGFAVLALILCRLHKDSILGLFARCGRENEAAAFACGIDIRVARYWAFVFSAVICGVAGIVLAHSVTVFSARSLFLDMMFAHIVMLVVGGMGSVTGAVLGTATITLLTEILRRLENGFQIFGLAVPQIFGLTTIGLSLAILIVLYCRREGLVGTREVEDFFTHVWSKTARLRETGPTKWADPDATSQQRMSPLTLVDVSKAYGGLRAVDHVSLTVNPGEVLGLIGPNGSGKTTLLGCIAGTHAVSSGSILLGGEMISDLPSFAVARRGIARNFQTIRLFARLTVLENVKAAMAQHLRSAGLGELDAKSRELLKNMGIEALADRTAGALAYGQQRRLEVARALANDPAFLLLDEPAAGLNEVETADLLTTLRRLVLERGIGLIIVDHDMHLVVNLCERIAVLNKGELLTVGRPLEVTRDVAVREAYLGRRSAATV
ncbi:MULTISPECIES: branched-chain amino acid ABC transporter ATP-binding protein/permease [unclassified Bradyrhizobium]|uniref:branched-chain amino acid ABC transporter ATP-binding protein/permease n=1 Tax=Bradyrhizobium sp. USDA 4541 TaxID=2817704 RepID=UPI0020A379B7|nr:branched-chain amino acid ABC transporter ATP-binding protein/permease [Bradyrhizobium sp. USDA 4541]MCP1848138.1 branched-chain amino acid transport system permease protein [Bradyrhizobium sp. USDA 4541]